MQPSYTLMSAARGTTPNIRCYYGQRHNPLHSNSFC